MFTTRALNGAQRSAGPNRTVPAMSALVFLLALPASAQIVVTQASYGANAGAPLGNATAALQTACNGSPGPCSYTVLVPALPDPAPGKQKDFRASWTCAGGPVQTIVLPASVGWNLGVGQQGPQSVVTLTCSAAPTPAPTLPPQPWPYPTPPPGQWTLKFECLPAKTECQTQSWRFLQTFGPDVTITLYRPDGTTQVVKP